MFKRIKKVFMKITTYQSAPKKVPKKMLRAIALDTVNLVAGSTVHLYLIFAGGEFTFYYPPAGFNVTIRLAACDSHFPENAEVLSQDIEIVQFLDGSIHVFIRRGALFVPDALNRTSECMQWVFKSAKTKEDLVALTQILLGVIPTNVVTENVGATATEDLANWVALSSEDAAFDRIADGYVDLHAFYGWKYLQLAEKKSELLANA